MIPDKAPKENVFHGSEDLKKEAHIPSFEKYKELYLKSIENPDGQGVCQVLRVYLAIKSQTITKIRAELGDLERDPFTFVKLL